MALALTTKQEKYVLGLVEGKSQRQAYKDAYNAKSMSDKVIDNKASELFKKDEIRVRYDELMKKLEDATIMSAKEVLEQLTKIGRAKITDFLEYRTAETIVEYEGEKVKDYSMVIVTKDSEEVDASAIQEIKLSKDGTFSFKLHSKMDALKELSKHHGLDKSSETANVEIEDLNPLAEMLDL